MSASLRDSIPQIANPGNLDASVQEAFALMLGCECRRIAASRFNAEDSLIAVVGFGGILSGACVIRSSVPSAIRMTALITGMEITALDATVQDALGEICNVIAGSWKSRIPELAAHCALSVPAVIAGNEYWIRVHPPESKLHHMYQFDESTFEVMIVCEGLR